MAKQMIASQDAKCCVKVLHDRSEMRAKKNRPKGIPCSCVCRHSTREAMETRDNRIVIPFDDFYDQFNPDMPPKLQAVMAVHEFESCIQVINKTITFKLLASRRSRRLRLAALIILGFSVVAAPVIVLLSGKGTIGSFVIPPIIFFTLFLALAVHAYRQSMNVSQLAAGSIETVLRDLNKKHTQQGLTWRLHKKSTINEDFGFDDNHTNQQKYSYWIEIELLENNFALLHEASTPELKRPLRPPPPPKSPMSLPDSDPSRFPNGPPPPSPFSLRQSQDIPAQPTQPLLLLDPENEDTVL